MLKDHKYCIYCGFELDKDDDGYCNECGKTNKYLDEYPLLNNEIDRLKQEISDLKFYLDESIEREKQLREALKKLSPYEIIQENDIQLSLCIFCRNDWDEEHDEDCEYVRLCKDK